MNLNQEIQRVNPDTRKIEELELVLAEERRIKSEGARIRAKEDKVEFDEQSTAYFFAKGRTRSQKSNISKLTVTEEDTETSYESNEQVLEVAKNFFAEIYDTSKTKIDIEKQNQIIEKIDKQLSLESRNALNKPLKLAELKKALKDSKNGKTPGIDGLPAEFYKKFSKELLPLLLQVANYSKDKGQMSKTQKLAVISLIHKGEEKDRIKNYRPISLLCVDLKLITKALASRLQQSLPEIVDESQTAGIPGRSIFNNLWQIRDMLEYAKQNCEIGYFFSLDQSNAF